VGECVGSERKGREKRDVSTGKEKTVAFRGSHQFVFGRKKEGGVRVLRRKGLYSEERAEQTSRKSIVSEKAKGAKKYHFPFR